VKLKFAEYENIDLFYSDVARCVVNFSSECIAKRGLFSMVLSGGKTPTGLYAEFVKHSSKYDWKNIHIFWGG